MNIHDRIDDKDDVDKSDDDTNDYNGVLYDR